MMPGWTRITTLWTTRSARRRWKICWASGGRWRSGAAGSPRTMKPYKLREVLELAAGVAELRRAGAPANKIRQLYDIAYESRTQADLDYLFVLSRLDGGYRTALRRLVEGGELSQTIWRAGAAGRGDSDEPGRHRRAMGVLPMILRLKIQFESAAHHASGFSLAGVVDRGFLRDQNRLPVPERCGDQGAIPGCGAADSAGRWRGGLRIAGEKRGVRTAGAGTGEVLPDLPSVRCTGTAGGGVFRRCEAG